MVPTGGGRRAAASRETERQRPREPQRQRQRQRQTRRQRGLLGANWGQGACNYLALAVAQHNRERASTVQALVFALESRRPPPLFEALRVCEAFRRRLLGVAGRSFGPDRIPPKFSGKSAAGTPLRDDHQHLHVFALSVGGGGGGGAHGGGGGRFVERFIDRVGVVCRAGFSHAEVELVSAVTLPALAGAPIFLTRTSTEFLERPATRFLSHTPFLPVRHPKRRRGMVREGFADQVALELRRRALPPPLAVNPLTGPWSRFRTARRLKSGSFTHLGAYGFEIVFDEPVRGPILLGRNCHFGMGLFLPVGRSA